MVVPHTSGTHAEWCAWLGDATSFDALPREGNPIRARIAPGCAPSSWGDPSSGWEQALLSVPEIENGREQVRTGCVSRETDPDRAADSRGTSRREGRRDGPDWGSVPPCGAILLPPAGSDAGGGSRVMLRELCGQAGHGGARTTRRACRAVIRSTGRERAGSVPRDAGVLPAEGARVKHPRALQGRCPAERWALGCTQELSRRTQSRIRLTRGRTPRGSCDKIPE